MYIEGLGKVVLDLTMPSTISSNSLLVLKIAIGMIHFIGPHFGTKMNFFEILLGPDVCSQSKTLKFVIFGKLASASSHRLSLLKHSEVLKPVFGPFF